MKFSNSFHALVNPVALVVLVVCIAAGYLTTQDISIRGFVEQQYWLTSKIFPLSTIEAHARASSLPWAARAELFILWLLSPVLWFFVSRISSRKLVRLRFHPVTQRGRYYVIYCVAIAVLFANIIFPIPGSHFCKGCESDTIFLNGLFKWGYFWGIGYSVGQIIALHSSNKDA